MALNAGRLLTLNMTSDPQGGGIFGPQNVGRGGNAFFVVDSPWPLSIKSDISDEQVYQMQTGESFPGTFQTLSVRASIDGVVQGLIVANFQVRIWIGPSNFQGFIDRRPILPDVSNEMMVGVEDLAVGLSITNGILTVPAGTGGQGTITPKLQFGQVGLVRALMLSNESATAILRFGTSLTEPLLTIFPYQTLRIPLSRNTPNTLPVVKPSPGGAGMVVYFRNVGGGDFSGPLSMLVGYNTSLLQATTLSDT